MFGLNAQQRAPRIARRRQVSRTASVGCPLGGWNARDSQASMPLTDAITLINWFPTPTDIRVRKGYLAWSTGYAAQVETLMFYSGDTQKKLFAASGTSFFDATASGAVGAAVQSGLANARWIHTNFTTTGGVRYLVAVNGADKMRLWDGTSWISVDTVSTPAITGLPGGGTIEIKYVTTHKSRVWLIRKNTMEAYYLPTGGFGAASLFDLRGVFRRGGTLVAAETWSIDGGYGLDDHLVFISSEGEVAIYQGTDPANIATWAIVGLYYFSTPVGTKPLYKYGGDILVLTLDGMYQLSQSLQSSRVNTQVAITDKIQYAIANQVSTKLQNYGWQMTSSPTENALVLNVPTDTNVWEQYVMNTITGAWTRFQGWNAACWETVQDQQYFGGPTYVAQAFTNYLDGTANISAEVKTAFNYFGYRGQLKEWVMVRPILITDGSPSVLYGLDVDFRETTLTGVPAFIPSTASLWDVALWDAGTWAGDPGVQESWQFISGLGYCGAFHMTSITGGIQLRMSSIDYVYKLGGVL